MAQPRPSQTRMLPRWGLAPILAAVAAIGLSAASPVGRAQAPAPIDSMGVASLESIARRMGREFADSSRGPDYCDRLHEVEDFQAELDGYREQAAREGHPGLSERLERAADGLQESVNHEATVETLFGGDDAREKATREDCPPRVLAAKTLEEDPPVQSVAGDLGGPPRAGPGPRLPKKRASLLGEILGHTSIGIGVGERHSGARRPGPAPADTASPRD